jgi:transposase, IS5 family
MLGRVSRDTHRKSERMALSAKAQTRLAKLLAVANRIHGQPRIRKEGDAPKIYSVHAPQVACIAKGKVHKKYEFGVKVGLVTTNKESFVLAAASLPGNPYDGHTLQACLDQAQRTSGVAATQVFVDKGYKGHGCSTETRKVFISGAKRGITPAIHKRLKRRNAIEPVIGQMKADGRLARNFLKGSHGAINALLCAAAHNLHKILNKLRLFLGRMDARLGAAATRLWQGQCAWLTFTGLESSIEGASIRFELKNGISQGRLVNRTLYQI